MSKANWFTALGFLVAALGLTYAALLHLVNLERSFPAICFFAAAGGYLLVAASSPMIPRALALIGAWLGHGAGALALSALFINQWSDTNATMFAYGVQAISQAPAAWYSIQWWLSLDGREHIQKIRLGLAGTAFGFLMQSGFAFLDHRGEDRTTGYLIAIGVFLAALGLALAAWQVKGVELQTIHTDVPKDKPQEPPTAD